jgi:hypothetical protein
MTIADLWCFIAKSFKNSAGGKDILYASTIDDQAIILC